MSEQKEYKEVAVKLKVRNDGMINLMDFYQQQGSDPKLHPAVFIEIDEVMEYLKGLASQCENNSEVIDDKHLSKDKLWVHPLVLWRYIGWCHPEVELQAYELLRQSCEDRNQAGFQPFGYHDKPATKH